MFDKLLGEGLRRIGVSEDQARSGVRIAVDEIRRVGSDMLAHTVEHQIRGAVRSQLLNARNALLANIADVPPPGFAQRLRLRGYNELTELNIATLWSDMIASIAEQPAPAAAAEEEAAVA